MTGTFKRGFTWMTLLALLAGASPILAKEKSEEELFKQLASPNADVVADGMLHLEKQYPKSPQLVPELKKMLTDSRSKVRRKAGRVLGVLHAEVDQADLNNIVAMFKASDPQEVMDALKSLRGLAAQSTLPEILPQLKKPDVGVLRDACRTVGALGTKANVADLEPLLKHPDPKVQKDAQDAIFLLNAK